MHISGEGTEICGPKALIYLEMGKDAGDPDAVALLGMILASGMPGVKINDFKARPLLETAAKNGDNKAKAMLNIVIARQRRKR